MPNIPLFLIISTLVHMKSFNSLSHRNQSTKKLFRPLGLVLGAVGVAFMLSACSPSTPEAPKPEATSTQTAFPFSGLRTLPDAMVGEINTLPAIAEINGQLAILFTHVDGRVALQIGDKIKLLDEGLEIKGGKYLQLRAENGALFAQWWSHEGQKNLYFTTSLDGGNTFSPVQVVNNEHGVLPPFSLLTGKDGVLGMLYSDERLSLFEVFFNRSNNNGKTWGTPDVRLDPLPEGQAHTFVLDPRMVKTDTAWVATWFDKIRLNGVEVHRIMVTTSNDEGKTWAPAHEVHRSGVALASLEAKSSGSNVAIVFEAHERGIHAVVSADNGANWKDIGAAANSGSDQLTNSGVDLVVFGGLGQAIWTASSKTAAAQTMSATIDIAQGTWKTAPVRVDTKVIDATRSTDPRIAATADGTLIASWNDYRDIRPNIYLSASFDKGTSWTAPQALKAPGTEYVDFARVRPLSKGILLSYQTHPNDIKPEGINVLQMLEIDPGVGFKNMAQVKVIPDDEREKMLKERVESFWKHRIAQEWEVTWDYFDYAFKVATPKDNYVRTMGVLTYHSANVVSVNMADNFARVEMKVNYEVKTIPVNGKVIKMPPSDNEISSEWIWINDNWYIVYAPAVGERFLQY